MTSGAPNVVWLTLESVRADHTTMEGYERETTPTIQRLADEPAATAFENCFAQSMWTPASSASILTGTYLSEHGVGTNAAGGPKLPPELTTLPALLAEQGYATACLSPNGYLSAANGLDRGFEDFHWLSKDLADGDAVDLLKYALDVEGAGRPSRAKALALLKYGLCVRSEGPGFTLDRQKHHLSYIATEMARRWTTAAARREDPFFLYAHIGNPHHPYCPPGRTRDRFVDAVPTSMRDAIELSRSTYDGAEAIRRLNANGSPLTDEEWTAIEALYDAEVAYADDCVRRIVEHVRSLDAGNTVFVVTADHGELFGEYGLVGHNLVLHDALIHVPLVISGLELDGAADGLVGHVDVTRTLAEVAGVGHDQFQGRDLRTDTPEYSLSQRPDVDLEYFRDLNPEFDLDPHHREDLTAVRTREFKYLESADRTRLFALPDETTDVSDTHPDVLDRLSGVVDDRVDWSGRPGAGEAVELTEGMRDQLADLGYL